MLQAFDTLKATKALRDAGFQEAQAEALVVTVNEAVIGNVATKDDLNIAKSDLKVEIGALRSELKEDIGAVRIEMADLRSEMKEMEARMDTKFSNLEAKIAEQSRDFSNQLWVMGLGIVGTTVPLTVGLIAIFVMPH